MFAGIVTVIWIAHTKAERLRLEFNELAEILKGIHDTRNTSDKIKKNQFEVLQKQISEIMNELVAAREGVISLPIGFKKRLRELEADVKEIIINKEHAEFVELLYPSPKEGSPYNQQILELGNRAIKMGECLSFYSLMIPG